MAKQFVEVLMAPAFTAEALEVFKAKVNVRLLQIAAKGGSTPWEQAAMRRTSSASARAS